MAMTLRLADDDAAALAAQAAREGRSQTEIVRDAIMEYVNRRDRRESLQEVLDEELPRYAEALKRLGQ
jgi:hypothetical protein